MLKSKRRRIQRNREYQFSLFPTLKKKLEKRPVRTTLALKKGRKKHGIHVFNLFCVCDCECAPQTHPFFLSPSHKKYTGAEKIITGKRWDTGDTMTVVLDCDKREIKWILSENPHPTKTSSLEKSKRTTFGPFKIVENQIWYAMVGWDGNNGVVYELMEE